MSKFRTILIAGVFLSLTACSIAPPKQTDSFTHSAPQSRSAETVYRMAKRCWSREFSFFKGDGFKVEEKLSNFQGSVISVRRYAPDIGYQEPFMLVYLKGSGDVTDVTVLEGQCAYGCELNWTSDVRRWLSGDEGCEKK